jgi:exopolysaccharide production protein ExoY
LPSRHWNKSTGEETVDFSAYAAVMRPYGNAMSGERINRKEAQSVPLARPPARIVRRQFRVIDHSDPLESSTLGKSGREVQADLLRDALKRILDIAGVAVLALVFAPLILAIVVLLHRQGGPIIFRHRRVGRDGKAFDCLKFRSMVPNAEAVLRDLLERQPELRAEWLRDHKLRHDPRITGLGRFLRRTSLDELPQLWNVIRGEMSLVGPRPVVREELLRYGRCAGIYLSARPGVTGLWQVKGRTNTNYRRRVALDVYYVRRNNLMLDLYILFKTTHIVLGGHGAY